MKTRAPALIVLWLNVVAFVVMTVLLILAFETISNGTRTRDIDALDGLVYLFVVGLGVVFVLLPLIVAIYYTFARHLDAWRPAVTMALYTAAYGLGTTAFFFPYSDSTRRISEAALQQADQLFLVSGATAFVPLLVGAVIHVQRRRA